MCTWPIKCDFFYWFWFDVSVYPAKNGYRAEIQWIRKIIMLNVSEFIHLRSMTAWTNFLFYCLFWSKHLKLESGEKNELSKMTSITFPAKMPLRSNCFLMVYYRYYMVIAIRLKLESFMMKLPRCLGILQQQRSHCKQWTTNVVFYPPWTP